MDSLTRIKELNKELQKVKDKYTKECSDLLVLALQENVFSEFPDVKEIHLIGYVPYFNDGEPCLFSMSDPQIKVSEFEEPIGEWDDNFEDIPKGKKIFKSIYQVIHEIDEDMFQSAFGSDVRVIFKSDGSVINEEYGEHD